MSDLSKYIQSQKFKLAGGGISISSDSITLQTFSLPNGTLIDSIMLGAINYGTLEPGGIKEEIISFTGVTQNIDGTATLTGIVRGLQFAYPYTTDSALALSHGGGVTFIISNNPQMYDNFANKKNDETIDGVWDFSTSPTVPTGGTGSKVANHEDLQNLSIAGASSASTAVQGIVRVSTSPDVTIGNFTVTIASPAVFTKTTHGLISGDIIKFTTSGALPTGISASTNYYVISSGLTADAFQISSTIGGTVINTSGSQSGTHTLIRSTPVAVGDNDTRLPTQGENDALVGTSGTPSSTNKYVTNDDTTGTGSVIRESYIDGLEWFGDGSDGDVIISTDTTLARDMFYNNLTVNNGIFLYANGYRIFVKGIITTIGTGKVDRSGNNGANGAGSAPPGPKINAAGGAALPAGTLTGVSAGGQGGGADNGNSFEAGAAAASVTNSIGVVGGAGGGPRPTGTVTAASPSIHSPYPVYLLDTTAILMRNATGQFNGSSSGAGGDSSGGNGGTRGGGGGGSSGGMIFIAAKEMNFSANDSIRAIGGNGGTGATSGLGNASGGGAGSGGVIVLIYKTMSGTTLTASTALAGGTGGTVGGSASGSNGTTGIIYSYQI